MTALLYTLGIVAFFAAILASIALHEVGHMVPARLFGGKVTQYFVGFGRTVWSRRIGETEYGVKAIPLGGFVKIVGMLPPGPGDEIADTSAVGQPTLRVRGSSTGLFTQLISDARAAEWEHISPADSERLFYKMKWWQKVIVMAAGPSVNIAIAFVIFAGVFATYGNPTDIRIEPVVHAVLDCVVPYEEDGRACTPDDVVTPAKLAGLQAGDRFVEVNGVAVTGWEQVQKQIRGNADGEAVITVDRDGELVTLTTNTTVTALPTSVTDDTLTEVGFLGVEPEAAPATGGLGYTLDEMGSLTVASAKALGRLPMGVWGVAKAIAGVEERAVDSPISILGGGRIAGETAAQEGPSAGDKAVFLLLLIAGFNFFIGLFNFIPLLPLDGGHIAGALYEAVRRGVARLRRKPDPGYVDVAKLLPVAYVVGSAMLVMGIVLIVGDLVAPLHVS
jgi:membrane-associated protease RseP (regulator of RpoE activity)